MQATDAAVFSGLSDGEASGGAEQWIVRQLALVQSGEALDTAAYRMTAEIAVTDAVLQPLPGQLDALDEAAPEAETGVTLAVMQAGDEGLQELDSATISATEAAPVFTVSVQSGTIAVLATTANPSYTVQYYAYIPRFAVSGGKTLNVYNTGGKNLPKNGKSNAQKQIFLTPAEGTTTKNAGTATQNYKVATTDELTQMYTASEFEYIKAPNPSYINIISNESWYETPLLTSYHINFVFPLVSPSAKVDFHHQVSAECYNDASHIRGLTDIDGCDAPIKNFAEQIYLQHLQPDHGFCSFTVQNQVEQQNLAVAVRYSENLDHLIHWQQFGEGDYVLGFEPANTTIHGRAEERANNHIVTLKPQDFVKYTVHFDFSL